MGYSSLNYLHEYPIKIVKIDKSFIQQMNKDSKVFTLVETIIDLSSKLGMSLVAEGVETSEQFEYLRETTCDEVQGYFISKPIQMKDFYKYVLNTNRKEVVSI